MPTHFLRLSRMQLSNVRLINGNGQFSNKLFSLKTYTSFSVSVSVNYTQFSFLLLHILSNRHIFQYRQQSVKPGFIVLLPNPCRLLDGL